MSKLYMCSQRLGYSYQSKKPCSYWAGPERVATSYGMKLAGVNTTRCTPRHMKTARC